MNTIHHQSDCIKKLFKKGGCVCVCVCRMQQHSAVCERENVINSLHLMVCCVRFWRSSIAVFPIAIITSIVLIENALYILRL